MARQYGNIKLLGSVGKFVFYKCRGEYFIRTKRETASIHSNPIRNIVIVRTRKHGEERIRGRAAMKLLPGILNLDQFLSTGPIKSKQKK